MADVEDLTLLEAADADAVIVEPLSPKVTLFEFEKTTFERLFDDPGADTFTNALAVTTDELLIPNATLLLLTKTAVPPVAVCVPAATFR